MPGVITARFRPFSFDEMLKPLAMATQEYNTVQEGLSSLTDSSNQFSRYLEGTEAGERVKQFNAAIDTAVTDMAKNGLRGANRDTLLGLKRQYNNDIAKINQSAAQLDTLYKGVQAAQLKAQASGDTLFVANMPNVDDLLANPSASPIMVSGAGLQAQGLNAAKALVAQSDSPVTIEALSKEYNNIVSRQGYNSAAAQKFLQNASTIPALANSIQQIKNMYGLQNFGADEARATQFIIQGMFDGLSQKVTNNIQQNPEYQVDLAYRKALAAARGKAEGKGAEDTTGSLGNISPVSMLDEGGENAKYLASLRSLSADGNGRGAKASKFGKQLSKSTNPLAAYEDRQKLYTQSVGTTSFGAPVSYGMSQRERARREQAIKDKYGITEFLTKDEYDTMKALGYDRNSDFSKFKYGTAVLNDMANKLNNIGYERTLFNMRGTADDNDAIKRASELFYLNASVESESGNTQNKITRLDEKLNPRRAGWFSANPGWSDINESDNPISTIGVYKGKKGLIVTTKKGERYEVSPTMFGTDAANEYKKLDQYIQWGEKQFEEIEGRKPNASDKARIVTDAYQAVLNRIMNMLANDRMQVRGKTNSKAGTGYTSYGDEEDNEE